MSPRVILLVLASCAAACRALEKAEGVGGSGGDPGGDGDPSSIGVDSADGDDTDSAVNPGDLEDLFGDGVFDDDLDRPCGSSGDSLLSAADAHLYSDQADYLAALQMDVGDATGDGVPDVLVSTLYADSSAGGGYLIPGPVSGEAEMSDVGYHLVGRSGLTSGAGRSIGVGDVEGDGVEDLGFGVPYASSPGMYLALGPVTGDRELATTDVVLSCDPDTYCGHGGDIGDFTGDGIADVVVGAYLTSAAGPGTGSVYALQGPITGEVDLTTDAVTIDGEEREAYLGRFATVGGDVNGDGLGDVLVAAPWGTGAAGPVSGVVYLISGPATIADVGASAARLLGASPAGTLGEHQSMSAGDLDGDGYDDVAVGAVTSTGGTSAGAVFVVFGPVSGDVDLHAADILVEGADAVEFAGRGLSVGDVNSDGVGELLIGSPYVSSAASFGGAGYLFLAPTSGTWTTDDADAAFIGDLSDVYAGTSAALRDLNGDGDADVLLGAPYDSTGARSGGGLFVFYAAE